MFPKVWTVLPAAGVGSRMQSEVPKQYLSIAGKPLIQHTLERLLNYSRLDRIIVVISAEDHHWSQLALHRDPRLCVATGGEERVHSVLNGLTAIETQAQDQDWVLVHDVARPCVRREDLDRLLDTLVSEPQGAILASPVTDTLKKAGDNGRITQTVPRAGIWRAFTPQAFRYADLRRALESALEAGELVTDEASAMERLGYQPALVRGSSDNIKVTVPEDLPYAEFLLRRLNESEKNQ